MIWIKSMQRMLLVLSLVGSMAQGAAPPVCYPIVPDDRLLVPANAPAFIGPIYGSPSTLTLREVAGDGGVRELERLDGGDPYVFGLFDPGGIAAGQQLILESALRTCTTPGPSRSQVTVLDAAAFPTELGPITFGEPVGFLTFDQNTGEAFKVPAVRRDVLVTFPSEQHPWLSMLRVIVNDAPSTFGHLARSVTPGTPTVVGSVVMICQNSDAKFTRQVELALEIPGHPGVVRASSMTELDCSKAPPPPGGCSSVPVLTLGALALWLRRRGPRLQQRREDEAIE